MRSAATSGHMGAQSLNYHMTHFSSLKCTLPTEKPSSAPKMSREETNVLSVSSIELFLSWGRAGEYQKWDLRK